MDFDPPGYNLSYDMWTRLATAHQALLTVREDLEAATEGIPACPAEPSPTRHPDMTPVLRTRELLHDVMGASAPNPGMPDTRRQAAARHLPQHHRRRTAPTDPPTPAPGPTTAGRPRPTR
ncbi:hypothetical protein ACIQI7_22145 [Kitasatospora sp. NPDC092039]|uniref:hypothetical protein n=1 Tax=Kitasatospora sp. NPDC092039 TaxID=3364086 RepID=UPI0038070BB0